MFQIPDTSHRISDLGSHASADHAFVELLRKCSLSREAQALLQGDAVIELNLGRCDIGDEEAILLADFLRRNKTVRKVRLVDNRFGRLGLANIMDALKKNQRVHHLSLSFNQLTDLDAELILDLLDRNVTLTSIDLRSNRISQRLLKEIAYRSEKRNLDLVVDTVRRAALFLIGIRRSLPLSGAGRLALLPKEIIKLIAVDVWATRKDFEWIAAVVHLKELE